MNVYQELLKYCPEEEIVKVMQLDYQDGKFNDFNAPDHDYTLDEYKALADRAFTVEECKAYTYRSGLDPLVKVYIFKKDGSGGAFEVLWSDENIICGWSSIPFAGELL